MAEIKLTPSQELAVKTRGSALLVSAAAGSGKTRVLVERLMSYVTDRENPRDIDTFLIITYTRAAAAELRSRILGELDKRLAADPGNRRLRRQSALCYGAQIGTIHNFCTRVIRENCHLLGLVPDFKVMEEDRGEQIKASVLEKLLEDAYENIDRDEGFRLLVDTVGTGRDDSRLSEIILSLYESMRSHAYPRDWAQEQIKAMDPSHTTDAGDTIWGKHLLRIAASTADYWIRELDRLLSVIYSGEENKPLAKAYGESIAETAEAIRYLRRALEGEWDEAAEYLPIPFPRLNSLRNFQNKVLQEHIKARRNACKKDMEALAKLFSDKSPQLIGDMEKTRPAMETLLRLTLDFDTAYSREKRRLGLLDFSDLEHLAVRLLVDRESGAPTWLAVELSQKYTEIMIDEYQDVNAVQELIFKAVSRSGRNLFMVGDVKQSIYRFRLADPGIFIDKYMRYTDIQIPLNDDSPVSLIPPEKGTEMGISDLNITEEGRRVLLQENFRSRASVLKAVNHVFENIMSTELGELDYDENAALKPGAQYPEGDCPVELDILALPEEEDEESPHKTEVEAEYVARRIRELMEMGTAVYENGAARPLDYGDIVILLRSPNSSGQAYRRALAARGIPVLAEQGGGFFTSLEISVMISLLAIIDNPHQDVPLISVLRSPLFGLTPDELALIRTYDRAGDFFNALKAASEENPKGRAFLEKLHELREAAPDMSVDGLIWHIYNQLDIIALTCAMRDGETGRENLMLLLEYARKFEENGYRGLFRFVAWLRRLAERGEEPRVGAARPGSAVRIMSIHKSKGLEFPVVFLSDTARWFNKNDLRRRVLVHPELGLGPNLTDVERGLEYPTLARRAIKRRKETESLSEEMRILYVAMTRARERLFITSAFKDPEKLISKLSEGLSRPLSPRVLEGALSPAHWLIQAALLDEEGIMKFNIVNIGKDGAEQAEKSADTSLQADNGKEKQTAEASDDVERKYQELARRLDYVYPYAPAVELPSKLTATEMKGRTIPAEMAEEAERLNVEEMDFSFRRPDFMKKETPLTGTEQGTATHAVMQHIDFSRTGSLEEIAEEISRLAAIGHITEKEAQAVDQQAVLSFFRSELGARVLKADKVFREFRFSLLCPAEHYFEAEPGEEILLQGVVDCCIEEAGELTIIDYKTDYVNQSNINERIGLYSGQLRTYAAAMKRITGKPVKQAVIYFLRAGIPAEVAI